MSPSPDPESVRQVRAAFHELLNVALDRLVAPLTGGVYSTFASIQLVEQDTGRDVEGAAPMPVGVAIALGPKSHRQLAEALHGLAASGAAAGDTVRTSHRSKGADHGNGS